MFIQGKQPGQHLGSARPAMGRGPEVEQRERDFLQAVLESGPEVITIIAHDGTILRTFRSRDALFGFEPGEVDGRNLGEFVHPDDHRSMQRCLQHLLSEPEAASHTILRVRNKAGQYLELECTGRNRLGDPSVRAIIVYSRDISEQVALERRLELAERMEMVGRTASGLAHDFNNVLTVIELSASRAALLYGEDREQQLGQIQRAAARASGLTKRLLSIARGTSQPGTTVDLGEVLREMQGVLRGLLPEHVSLTLELPESPRYVVADAAQVEQVVLNLVLNARDAVLRPGRIVIRLEDERDAVAGRLIGRVLLSVQDNGVGMDEATRHMAPEPFFTTKAESGGTGIGLWMVKDFAIRAGGTVALQSEPGVGTRCELSLPTVDHGMRTDDRGSEPPPALEQGGTVLLVEDEPALRQTVAELLRDSGHHVLTARDGREALDVAGRNEATLDAVITDVIMPRVGGVELVRTLRERSPDLGVLFVSGCGESDGMEVPGALLLRKPFPAQALIDSVARLLAARQRSRRGGSAS